MKLLPETALCETGVMKVKTIPFSGMIPKNSLGIIAMREMCTKCLFRVHYVL